MIRNNLSSRLTCFFIFPLLALLLFPTLHSKAATYNITSFGADGTDTKSDNAAIQKVLDLASEEEPLTVIIPNGTYYISKTLYVQSNTTIKLASKATIIRNKTGINKNMLRTSDSKHKSNKAKGYTLAHDITITGGTWNGGDIDKAKSTSNLIYMGHSQNITISNTTIKNCYGSHAIEFAGVKNSVIRNCKITGFRYDKTLFTAEAIQVDICYKDKGDDGSWTPGFKLDKTTSSNILIENNVITDYPRGIGIHHKLKGHEVNKITIQKNKIKRSSAAMQGKSVVGVFILGAKNCSVKNNTFDRCSYGAMIKVSTNITLKSNKFKYNPIRNLSIESCNKNNGVHSFIVTKDDVGTKTFKFKCGNIKSGYIKTAGKKYNFKSKKGAVTVKLKKKIKSYQTVTFYGKDKYNNKYYRSYTVPKQTKKKKNKK